MTMNPQPRITTTSLIQRLPNGLLAAIGTIFWRNDRARNAVVREVERRWPKVFLSTWRKYIVVRVKRQQPV